MATHKVPQDVEADDKLIGFLSLKQFIFTVLGLGFGYLTFIFAARIHPLASIIWIPPMAVCLVLGLYQRKDQPVEVYLASALQFYLKPHKRKWDQEGYEERVMITAPPKIEKHYTKDFSSEEATSRLTSLSRMMDSRGWASKMVADWQNPQLASTAASERLVQPHDLHTGQTGIDPQNYTQPVDVMDETTSLVAQDMQSRISQTESTTKQHAMKVLQKARESASQPENIVEENIAVPTYRKFPTMRQKVIQPEVQEVASSSSSEVVTAPIDQAVVEPPAHAPTAQIKQLSIIDEPKAVAPIPVNNQPTPNQTPPTQPIEQIEEDGSVEIKLH